MKLKKLLCLSAEERLRRRCRRQCHCSGPSVKPPNIPPDTVFFRIPQWVRCEWCRKEIEEKKGEKI